MRSNEEKEKVFREITNLLKGWKPEDVIEVAANVLRHKSCMWLKIDPSDLGDFIKTIMSMKMEKTPITNTIEFAVAMQAVIMFAWLEDKE